MTDSSPPGAPGFRSDLASKVATERALLAIRAGRIFSWNGRLHVGFLLVGGNRRGLAVEGVDTKSGAPDAKGVRILGLDSIERAVVSGAIRIVSEI